LARGAVANQGACLAARLNLAKMVSLG